MGMKDKIGLLALAAALLDGGYGMNNGSNSLRPEDIDTTPKKKPIPKGCKRYYYNKNGECNNGEHEIYFDAMKKETAMKKYNKWCEQNQPI